MNAKPLSLLLYACILIFSLQAHSQTITPFALRFQTAAKGGIEFVSNTILECNGLGSGGAFCPDLSTQLPPTFDTWSQNNDHIAEYIDIDADATTFSSSADSLHLDICSEIVFAGIYWGGRSDDTDPLYPDRASIKIEANGGAYEDITADFLVDAGAAEGLGNRVYYCFADITDFVQGNPVQSKYTVANLYSRLQSGSNRWGGWNIVVVYKSDLEPFRSLNVFDGLVNVNDEGINVEVGISGFVTPASGPVSFEVGVYGYDGDRGFVGDSLLFDGGSGFTPISNALNPADDIFNFSQTTKGIVSTSQDPLIHNNISIDADIFAPDNTGFPYIGNSATSGTLRITTDNETVHIQTVTLAIDVDEPDLRTEVRVEDINGGAVEPGDILEYTVVGKNVGTDPSLETYITDTLEGNIEFVPGSIEVIFGPNLGVKTDAGGDDQGEFIAADNVVRVNIGTGADALTGGTVNDSPTGIDSTVFTFRATVTDDCVHLSCDNIVENQAHIHGTGSASGNNFVIESTPGTTDIDGCPDVGSTSVIIDNSSCVLPNDTIVANACAGDLFADFPYDEDGYEYYDGVGVVTGPTATGDYYAINEAYPGCRDTVLITIVAYDVSPTASDAGLDQDACIVPGTATLDGNDPVIGTGTWTVFTGGATITTPSEFDSGVTGLTVGENRFIWTITNDIGCPDGTDTVTIVVSDIPSTAAAGDDQVLCSGTTATLDGNSPAVGTGEWTIIAGGGAVTDPALFNSGVTGLTPGVNTFRWTISNGSCPPDFDEVDIIIDPDTDGDGACDTDDLDDDNDGIPDTEEGDLDSDGDGIIDRLDLDSDNDGIPDVVEAGGTDADGDGLIDGFTDGDGDGLAASVDPTEGGTPLDNPDTDGDGNTDAQDLDSDNDGIPDITEAGGVDTNNDGKVDDATDTDGDGFADLVDTDDGGTSLGNPDSDGDGVLNVKDLDSDNDGIPDITEAGGTDTNNDGMVDAAADTDGDGLANVVDPDDGGTPLDNSDSDLDGLLDILDLDSDNDGILDITEAQGTDANNDGKVDDETDTDGDGLADVVDPDDGGTPFNLTDTDSDGLLNSQDIDADGDGIVDAIEGQPSGAYVESLGSDADGDGIDDAFDVGAGGTPIGDNDTDGDDTPDYLDLDSDNDGESDAIEGHDLDGNGTAETVPSGLDSDGDGLDNAFDGIDLTAGTSFTNAGNGTANPLTDGVLADADNPGVGDLDFRERDNDSDGIPDSIDEDDDNDGIPDLAEDANEDGDGNPLTDGTDTDGDGILDIFDLDSDNDGVFDIVEAGGTDTNNDGIVDDVNGDGTLINDTDNDGLDDLYDADNGGEDIPAPDSDGDGKADFHDIDSDNDGIPDFVENGGTDADGDGMIDDFNDTNGDGADDDDLIDEIEDTDGDGVPDYIDLDSDNDGVSDLAEEGGIDTDGDGMIDDFIDENGDGGDDDELTDGQEDFDGDGVPNHEDLDSDNDGITDAEENGAPDDDHDGIIDDFTDSNGDGWDDDNAVDIVDTDEDGAPDQTDLDADGDGILDIIEGGGTDTDDDGIVDDFIDDNGDGLNDDGGLTPPDTDGDGRDDYQDVDSDGDSVPDSVENDPNEDGVGLDDTDGDGIPNYLDDNDDNDDVPTIEESDLDDNNEYVDCDRDGIPDYLDPDFCGFIIPTGFSPDNDGINDFFVIVGIEAYPNASIVIFNRWGNKVFESNDGYANDWDGTNQFGVTTGGNELPVGTYFYVLDLGEEDEEVIKGYVYIKK